MVTNEVRVDTLSPSTTILYPFDEQYTQYILQGPGSPTALTGNIVIDQTAVSISIAAYEGTTYNIMYTGNYIYNGSGVITIFGKTLTSSEALDNLYIKAVYVNGSWVVQILDHDQFNSKRYELTAVGGTDLIDPYAKLTYIIDSTSLVTLSSSYTFDVNPGLFDPLKPAHVKVHYSAAADLVTNNTNITILGQALTQQQAFGALNANSVIVDSVWDIDNGAWISTVIENKNQVRLNSGVQTYTYTSGHLDIYVDPNVDKHDIVIQYLGTPGDNLTGDIDVQLAAPPVFAKDGEEFVVKYKAQLNENSNTVTLFGEVLTTVEVLAGNTTVRAVWDGTNSTWITQKTSTNTSMAGLTETLAVPVSFETNEVGNIYVPVDYNCNLLKVDVCVSKVLSGTDDGTITITDGGFTVYGSVTVPQSSVVGYMTSASGTPLASLTAGNILGLQTAKTTPDGRAICYLTLQRV